jgi:hypothetical protein
MCLSRVFTDEEMEEWLADKPEVIEVWKVATPLPFASGFAGWVFSFEDDMYKSGLDNADTKIRCMADDNKKYYVGFHFFVEYCDLGFYKNFCAYKIIKCYVKKEWITAIGTYDWCGREVLNLVASQAVFPHYPETEARLEDVPQEKELVVEQALRGEKE